MTQLLTSLDSSGGHLALLILLFSVGLALITSRHHRLLGTEIVMTSVACLVYLMLHR